MDECGYDSQPCLQICVNDEGSFHCECFQGFALNPDQFSCRGMTIIASAGHCFS